MAGSQPSTPPSTPPRGTSMVSTHAPMRYGPSHITEPEREALKRRRAFRDHTEAALEDSALEGSAQPLATRQRQSSVFLSNSQPTTINPQNNDNSP